MRKRYHKFNHKDGLYKTGAASSKTAKTKKVSKKAKKKNLKFALYSLLVVFLVMVGYVAYSSLSVANDVFAGGISFETLLNRSPLEQTDGVTNILLLGRDQAALLTDTIEIIRIRQSDGAVAMISLPRDLRVTIPGNGAEKINGVFKKGYNAEQEKDNRIDAGADLAQKTISEVAGVPIHYYITANFSGLMDLVEALGGVTVDVEEDLYDPTYPDDGFTASGQYYNTYGTIDFSLKAGIQQMDGLTALRYARSRKTTSDFDRAARQQNLIFSIKDKALSLGVLTNPSRISNILNALGDNLKTDMSISEFKGLVDAIGGLSLSDVRTKVIDNNVEDGLLIDVNEGGYYLVPVAGDFSEVRAYIKNIFNITTLKDVEVEVLNGSDVVGRAGELAETLEEAGFNVTNIDNYEGEMEKTTIWDGTSKGEVFEQLSKYIDTFEHTGFDKEGTIVIIIGQDYAN